jgi:glutathione S-transferase
MIELYQFRASHFCEKARWALDYKGAAFRTSNLLPGFHFFPVRMVAPKTSVPLLRDGKTVVQGSGEIIDYLDAKYPQRPLTPPDAEEAAQAREWERFCDEEIGVHARRWFYYHTLPNRRAALGFLLVGAPWHKRMFFAVFYPIVRPVMMRFMDITDDTARESEVRFRAALEKLDAELQGRRYLVGGRFSRADLTACSLMAPICRVSDAEASATFAPAPLRFREEVKNSRVYAWVHETYAAHRADRPNGGIAGDN